MKKIGSVKCKSTKKPVNCIKPYFMAVTISDLHKTFIVAKRVTIIILLRWKFLKQKHNAISQVQF